MNTIDEDWESFLKNEILNEPTMIDNQLQNIEDNNINTIDIPKCSDIYISTKTKIAYLNTTLNINELFWKIPIMNYYNTDNGIIKKQIKITTLSKEETNYIDNKLNEYNDNLKNINILSHVNTKDKYKHIQKISLGISKKDITSYRLKEKSAFFNCFAIILRMKFEGEFKEIHIKIFKTGKLEIPGIISNILLENALIELTNIISNIEKKTIEFNKENIDTVLINSNFNSGYYINREKLFDLLKNKYKLITMYDPCSYPGIQSKFYYNYNKKYQDGLCNCKHACNKKNNNDKLNVFNKCKEVSFMIFRTGSVLIVGNCDENILNEIYVFLVKILETEFYNINEGLFICSKQNKKVTKKIKKIKIISSKE